MRTICFYAAALALSASAFAQTAALPIQPASIGVPHECKGHYPPDAVDEHREGRTLLGFVITPRGTVENMKVLKSSGHDDLDLAAAACASKWEYRPAMLGDKPVAAQWKAYVMWVDEPPATPLRIAIRPVRRDAWHCLWGSPAAKTLPPDFTNWLEVHIRFGSWLRKTTVDVSRSSGNAALDEAAAECVRKSPHLADAEASKGESPAIFVRLAWWHTGA